MWAAAEQGTAVGILLPVAASVSCSEIAEGVVASTKSWQTLPVGGFVQFAAAAAVVVSAQFEENLQTLLAPGLEAAAAAIAVALGSEETAWNFDLIEMMTAAAPASVAAASVASSSGY